MISLNLLPDSKLEHLQGVRKQRKVSALCFGAIAAGAALPIILVAVWGGQKALLGIVQGNIDEKIDQLQSVEDLEQILTVQNQLRALPGLYDQRLFYTTLLGVLPTLLPADAHLSSVGMNESNQLELAGLAANAATVNDFISILTTASLRDSDGQTRPAFTSISLGEIQPGEAGATFSVTVTVDPALLQTIQEPDLMLGDRVLKAGQDSPVDDTTSEGTDQGASGTLLPEEAVP